jgi:hypothetical protein
LGFVIIGLILFTSGTVSVLQLMQMEKTVTDMNETNILRIEASVRVFDEAKRQTWKILDIMHDNSLGDEARIVFNDTLYLHCFEFIRKNISLPEERRLFDTLCAKYRHFEHHTALLDSLFMSDDTSERNEWFNNLYRPVYESFVESASKLEILNRNTVFNNSAELRSDFYRMIIPLTVAVTVGLFLIILFNYLINFYFIDPLLKIIKGIEEYSVNKQPYNVKISANDEMSELNREVKSLISQTKQKESVGVFNFNE